ncbi:hypothetical protein GJ496_009122 [Pomphorhynchus laevis]|nr:hypothetical protein GJ496_009122 [Pomphorhynchus laevis]
MRKARLYRNGCESELAVRNAQNGKHEIVNHRNAESDTTAIAGQLRNLQEMDAVVSVLQHVMSRSWIQQDRVTSKDCWAVSSFYVTEFVHFESNFKILNSAANVGPRFDSFTILLKWEQQMPAIALRMS